MATSYKSKIYTTLGTPTNITTAITPLSVSNSSGVPVKDYTVKGRSIVWNQLVKNGNFVDTTGWSTHNGTGSVSNNKYTFTVSGTQTYANVLQYMDKSVFVAGHKYYVTATITPQYSAGKVTVALHNGATIQENLWTTTASSGKTNFVSTTFTISSAFVSSATTGVRFILYCPQTESAQGNITVISNVWMVDLTRMFGAGNEPNSAQFRTLFPEDYYEYDAGTIKSISNGRLEATNANQSYKSVNIPVETYFPDGFNSVGNVYDEISFSGQTATRRIGVRSYQDGDENESSVLTDKTTTLYVLSTPTITNIPKKLQALPTYKGFNSFSFPNNVMSNGPFSLTYYAEGGTNPEKGLLTSYKRKIYTGKTIEFNQMLNLSSFAEITAVGVTISKNGNKLHLKGTATSSAGRVSWKIYVSLLDGHKYYAYKQYDNLTGPYLTSVSDTSKFFNVEMFTCDVAGSYAFGYNFVSGTSYDEDITVMLFDLTQMFGAGNEPSTPAEFWQYFDNKYYPYNTGETQPLFLQSRKAITEYTITNTQNKFIFDVPDAAKSATILGWEGQSKVINGVLYDGGLVSVRIDGKNLITPARDSFTVTSSGGAAVIASGETMKNIAKNSTTKRNSSYLKIDTVDAVFNPSSNNRVGMEANYSVSGELKYSPSVWITGTSFLSGTNNDVQAYRTTIYSSDYEEASTYNPLRCYVQGLTSGTVTTKDFEIRENKASYTIPTDITSLTGYGMGIGDLYNSVERHESGDNFYELSSPTYIDASTTDKFLWQGSITGALEFTWAGSVSTSSTAALFLVAVNGENKYIFGDPSPSKIKHSLKVSGNITKISLVNWCKATGTIESAKLSWQTSGWHYVQRVGNITFTQELLETASETGTTIIDGKTVAWARNIQFPDNAVKYTYHGLNGWANMSILGDVVFNSTKYSSTQYRMYFMNYSSIEDVKTALGTDGVMFHYQIATPVITDISDKIADSFLKDISVIPGGKVVMYNNNLLDVPSTIKWKI